MTHFVLIVPLDVTTPWITFEPNVPSFVRISSTAQFSTTLAPDLVENLDRFYLNSKSKCPIWCHSPRQSCAQAMRVNGPVSRGVQSAVYVRDIHQRVELLGVLWPEDVAVHAHDLANRVEPLVFLQSFLVVGNKQAAVVDPSWLYPRFRLEVCQDLMTRDVSVKSHVTRDGSPCACAPGAGSQCR